MEDVSPVESESDKNLTVTIGKMVNASLANSTIPTGPNSSHSSGQFGAEDDKGDEDIFVDAEEPVEDNGGDEEKEKKKRHPDQDSSSNSTIGSCKPSACKPVKCEPVECKPVECEPVECKPVECKPVECQPVKCEPVACKPGLCKPGKPRSCSPCKPAGPCEPVPCKPSGSNRLCKPCRPVKPWEGAVPCKPVACEPVACTPVRCQAVPCSPVDCPAPPAIGGEMAMTVPVALAVGAAASVLALGVVAFVGFVIRYLPVYISGTVFVGSILLTCYLSSRYPASARELGQRVLGAVREAATSVVDRATRALTRHLPQVSSCLR